MSNDINWTKYREGLEQQMLEYEYATSLEDANFMADLLVLIAKRYYQSDKGVDWEHIESLIQKVISSDGYMAVIGY